MPGKVIWVCSIEQKGRGITGEEGELLHNRLQDPSLNLHRVSELPVRHTTRCRERPQAKERKAATFEETERQRERKGKRDSA